MSTNPIWLFNCLILGHHNSNQTYFFRFLIKHLSNKETKKLTVAPAEANIIVFAISSEFNVAAILKSVPPMVPTSVLFGSDMIVNGELTHCR